MRMEGFDGSVTQRYATNSGRSLIGMVARRALHRTNGATSLFFVRPFVVMAARALGPGPTRLRLVKLAHNLSTPHLVVEPAEIAYLEGQAPVQPTQRAA
jgi:hypothetical protein